MKNTLISIIIPTYEEEGYVQHILSQFSPSLRERCSAELIISDGGSSDNTVALAHSCADKVLEAKSTQTISMGRNAGAQVARGTVLMFFNADVRLNRPEEFILKMYDTVREGATVAATCNVLVNPEEETLSDKLFHHGFNWYCRLLNTVGMGMGRGECHVVQRIVFDQSGGYNENIVAGEDYEFFMRLKRIGKIAFVKSLTVYESPRRYRAYGYLRIGFVWFANAISVLLFKRSLSKQWTPVR